MFNIKESLLDANRLLTEFIYNSENIIFIENISEKIANVFINGNKILICGNGGSAADAMHFAEEFTGNFMKKRKALPVMALTDPTHITCVGNDYGFDKIFSRGIEAFGKKNDILIALSTSGNSLNIIEAIKSADKNNLICFAFLGRNGGVIKKLVENHIIIKSDESSRIQELHMMMLHLIIEKTESILYEKGFLQ